jgi:modulator of FtsH protease HflC
MKKLITILVIIAIVLIIFLLLGPFYVVQEGEQAVVTRFGKIVSVSTDAGLKFKSPLIDNVVKYPKKIISWDGAAQRIPTEEQQFIWVDATARWKISDPQLFYEAVTTLEQGYGRLDDVIDSSVRTIIARYPLREAVRNTNIINEIERKDVYQQQAEQEAEVEEGGIEELRELTQTDTTYETIRTGRSQISQEMYNRAAETTPQYGIELVDIIIRQIRYSDDLTESVYQRMIKERNRIAEAFRSYGEGKKAEWLGNLEREKKTILSQAYETAEEIKGTADAEATRIYAESYQQDEEFFEFWRSIESYKRMMPKFRKTLTTDMDYFRFLHDQEGG